MSLISKEHLNLTLQSIKKLLSGKADKSELDKVSEKAVQSDWSQNDPNAPDYVKNRTHWEEPFTRVLWEENITITGSYYESTQFYYAHDKLFSFNENNTYDVTFLGETFEGVQPHQGALFIELSSGAEIYINSAAMYSEVDDGLSRPFTTDIKIVEHGIGVNPIDEKYIPDTIARVNDVNDLVQRVDGVYYGTCSSTAATSEKVVRLQHGSENFKLKTGVIVSAKFTFSNTSTYPSLNVNSTGAKSIKLLDSAYLISSYWQPYSYVTFLYDGSCWNIISISPSEASTTYYGLTKLNNSYTSSSTITAATSDAVRNAYNRGSSAYNLANAALPKSGGTMTGNLTLKGNPTSNLHAATKQYVDNEIVKVNNKIVQPNWNQMDETATDYIKNKTHYAIGGGVILEEQTLISEEDISCNKVSIPIAENPFEGVSIGDSYDIYFNGSLYVCTVKNHYAMGNIIGNVTVHKSFENGNNTGEPFIISAYANSDVIWVYTLEPMEFTLKIVKHEFFKALDEKFIPDTIARTEDIENYVVDLVGDTKVSEQINNAVSQKSQVQIITWGEDD